MKNNKYTCKNGCHNWEYNHHEEYYQCKDCGKIAYGGAQWLMDAEHECLDLRVRIAQVVKERDEIDNVNEGLRDVLRFIMNRLGDAILYYDEEEPVKVGEFIDIALCASPTKNSIKVQKLIDALKEAQQIVNSTEFPTVAKMIDDAIKEWKGEI